MSVVFAKPQTIYVSLEREPKMIEPSELDLAQLKHEMRQMYKNVGFDGSLQIIFEMLVGARILSEVIMEERSKNEIN